jgi:hypothetical protein
MKHLRWLAIGALLIPSGIALAQVDVDDDDDIADRHEPVQFYLTASITDHINLDTTEDRLRRILPMLDRYRKVHPEANVTATLLFSGAVSQALADRNPQTHIVDFVKDFIQRGVIEAGYDGDDEPTYKTRPVVQFKIDSPEERWLARSAAVERFLTEARDPATGAVLPGKTGGLKKMQEVFGEAAVITGAGIGLPALYGSQPEIGSDSEAIHQIRRYNSQALMFGLPDENPLHSVAYRKWSQAFGMDMSPYPVTPPELFWQDGVLRTSEAVGRDNQLFLANNGPAALSYVIKALNRDYVRIIHIELGSEQNYLTKKYREEFIYPPTRYAYNHPDKPRLPAEAFLEKSKVDAAFAKEDELLDWLTDDYLPEHRDSHLFSNAGLRKATPPAFGYEIPMKDLRSAVQQTLKEWGDQPAPPKYVHVQEIYFLSLAETFQVLADALAEESRAGKLPEKVRVAQVHGPLEVAMDLTPVVGETTAATVAQAAAGLVAKLHDDAWSPVPNNTIPKRVKVGSLDLNPAQFLRLMAETLVAATPNAKLKAKPESMFATQDFLGMRTRASRDMGVVWTYKPAVFLTNLPAALSAAK